MQSPHDLRQQVRTYRGQDTEAETSLKNAASFCRGAQVLVIAQNKAGPPNDILTFRSDLRPGASAHEQRHAKIGLHFRELR